jgi:hypothetical protein
MDFWTSSETSSWKSDWLRIARDRVAIREKLNWPPSALIRFEIMGAPKILQISQDLDWLDIAQDLGFCGTDLEIDDEQAPISVALREIRSAMCSQVLWDRLAKTHDAIHVPADIDWAQQEILSDWECESTLWFRPKEHLRTLEVRGFDWRVDST